MLPLFLHSAQYEVKKKFRHDNVKTAGSDNKIKVRDQTRSTSCFYRPIIFYYPLLLFFLRYTLTLKLNINWSGISVNDLWTPKSHTVGLVSLWFDYRLFLQHWTLWEDIVEARLWWVLPIRYFKTSVTRTDNSPFEDFSDPHCKTKWSNKRHLRYLIARDVSQR